MEAKKKERKMGELSEESNRRGGKKKKRSIFGVHSYLGSGERKT